MKTGSSLGVNESSQTIQTEASPLSVQMEQLVVYNDVPKHGQSHVVAWELCARSPKHIPGMCVLHGHEDVKV